MNVEKRVASKPRLRVTNVFVVLGPMTDFRRPRRLTGGAGAGLALSVLVHTAAAVSMGAVLHASTKPPAPHPASIEVDVAAATNVPGVPTDASSSRFMPARSASASTQRRPRARVDSSPRSVATEIPRFVLTAGTVATRGSVDTSTFSSAPGGVARPAGPVDEGEVDAPARLLSTSPLVYPAAAREAAIELDLPLEVVIDTEGRVATARVLGRAGFGLDEAALRAIRLYRFSAAVRMGRPVRVRMRWTVQFRLR
jgi:TonB family protein